MFRCRLCTFHGKVLTVVWLQTTQGERDANTIIANALNQAQTNCGQPNRKRAEAAQDCLFFVEKWLGVVDDTVQNPPPSVAERNTAVKKHHLRFGFWVLRVWAKHMLKVFLFWFYRVLNIPLMKDLFFLQLRMP